MLRSEQVFWTQGSGCKHVVMQHGKDNHIVFANMVPSIKLTCEGSGLKIGFCGVSLSDGLCTGL